MKARQYILPGMAKFQANQQRMKHINTNAPLLNPVEPIKDKKPEQYELPFVDCDKKRLDICG